MHLARIGWDSEHLFELTDIPFEFLRDPSGWISATDVESFLRAVERAVEDGNFIATVGHSAHDLKAWGVLDSVLRMMQKPQDIFAQPHRFISYFISPAPPIGNLQRQESEVSFDLPISNQEYPLVTSYLVAAIEGLPHYLGKEPAQVRWRQTNIRIHYSESQTSLLNDDDAPLNPKPELMRSMVENIEWATAQMEERDATILRLQDELGRARSEYSGGKSAIPTDLSLQSEEIKRQLSLAQQAVTKLTDYLTRTQQALMFAKTMYRKDPQLNEILRRIDWENVRTQFPWSHLQAMEAIESARNLIDKAPSKEAMTVETVAIASVLDEVVERLRQENPAGLEVKHLSFIEKPVMVNGQKIPMALHQILSAAARDIAYRGLAARDGDGGANRPADGPAHC